MDILGYWYFRQQYLASAGNVFIEIAPSINNPVTLKKFRITTDLASSTDVINVDIRDPKPTAILKLIAGDGDIKVSIPQTMTTAVTTIGSTDLNLGSPRGEIYISYPYTLYLVGFGLAANDEIELFWEMALHGTTLPTITLTNCAIDGGYTDDYNTVVGI